MIYNNDDNKNVEIPPPIILSTPTISRERTKTHNEKKGLDKLVLTPQKEGAVKIANSSNTYQLGIHYISSSIL